VAEDGVSIAVPPVLDGEAKALYLRMLQRGGVFRLDGLTDGDKAALGRLARAGLTAELQYGYWSLVDPRRVATRLRDEYRAAAAELLARADEPVRRLADLADAYDRAPRSAPGGSPITHVDDLQEIQKRIEDLAADAKREVLTMQPGGARGADNMRMARTTARIHRDRGIELRTVYQPGARTDPATSGYAAYLSEIGGRVRILDEHFDRLLVIDRSVAVIPGVADQRRAVFVEDPVLVATLVDDFERYWARAERVRWGCTGAPDPLVALLAQGLTQRAIANRLGLSERTVTARITRLREEYDADTLFQLGWLAQGER
jgi:sugar-specific transcriptional regulator TrmB